MVTIGIINNLNAKKNARKGYTSEKLQKVIGTIGIVKDTHNLKEMEHALNEFKERKVKILGISGGDGTIQRVLTAWIRKFGEEKLPYIMLMAGGATNTIMNGIGQKIKNPLETLKDFVQNFKKSKFKFANLYLLKVSYNGNTEYGASFANGILYKMEKKYLEDGKPGVYGVFREVMEIITGIFLKKERYINFIEPVNCTLYVDSHHLMDQIVASGLSVLSKPFPVVDPFHNLSGEGIYYLVSSLGFIDTLRYLPSIITGRVNKVKIKGKIRFIRGVAKKIIMITTEGFTIDGELFETNKGYEISITKGPTINFILP